MHLQSKLGSEDMDPSISNHFFFSMPILTDIPNKILHVTNLCSFFFNLTCLYLTGKLLEDRKQDLF